MTMQPPRTQGMAELAELVAHLDRVVVGKGPELEIVLAAILAGGHVLIEDVPGVGKTLAAKAIASRLGLTFARIQFTPDMLPSDVTGAVYFDQRDREFVFRRGPVFAGLVLADEINRAPAKTQAALLQAMAEQEVSVDGTTHALPRPFHVIATANPIEYEGTFALPEAQLDRFLVRAAIGYPDEESELHLVRETARHGVEVISQAPESTAPPINLPEAQHLLRDVTVTDEVTRYIVDLVVKACGQGGTGKPQPPTTAPTVLDPPVTASRRARLERVLALVQLLPPWAVAHPDSLSPLAHQARTHTDADIDHLAKKVMEALGQ